MDHFVKEKMLQLRTNAHYKLAIVFLKSYCSKILIVKSFSTRFLTLHFEDVLADPNLLASHIFCLNEKIIKNVHVNSKNYIV